MAKEFKKELCPFCNNNNYVGRIGHNRFYCSKCNIEFLLNKEGKKEIYRVLFNGSLEKVEDKCLFCGSKTNFISLYFHHCSVCDVTMFNKAINNPFIGKIIKVKKV